MAEKVRMSLCNMPNTSLATLAEAANKMTETTRSTMFSDYDTSKSNHPALKCQNHRLVGKYRISATTVYLGALCVRMVG